MILVITLPRTLAWALAIRNRQAEAGLLPLAQTETRAITNITERKNFMRWTVSTAVLTPSELIEQGLPLARGGERLALCLASEGTGRTGRGFRSDPASGAGSGNYARSERPGSMQIRFWKGSP